MRLLYPILLLVFSSLLAVIFFVYSLPYYAVAFTIIAIVVPTMIYFSMRSFEESSVSSLVIGGIIIDNLDDE